VPGISLKKIFCVIDPTTNTQRALARAANVALQVGAEVHAYVCFSLTAGGVPDDRREEAETAEYARHRAWMAEIVAPYRADGVTITFEIECRDDWRAALVDAANRSGADIVFRASVRRTTMQRRMLKTADWMLLRGVSCPVLFVKSERIDKVERVLAAVNIRSKDEPHRRLTEAVIAYAQAVARLTGAELHAVNSYSGSVNFVHPPDLARRVGVERRCAHVGDGAADEVISQVVGKLQHPLVVIGAIPRAGMASSVVGNTAERILDTIDSDTLCIVQQA
jgi:universal stress protein E